ncbi:YkvA family protein [Thermospira aquatica]|uniref:DUF1232 domain-containing protein n=1 Tax=Thermospira aquatica TaxID=2828656 RepID=A0AAX3BAJ8_9SPIR|nr:YkvA family protein [Thermospira aquatica]URA09287.1 DUF1232 domain-containing protein [Thermospira aquatica]
MKKDVFYKLVVLERAWRHPRCPWYAKGVIVVTLVLAVSPFDLIPDFIPILGQLDDLFFIPLGIALAWKLIPEDIKKEGSLSLKTLDPSLMQRYKRIGLVIIGLWWIAIIGIGIYIWIKCISPSFKGSFSSGVK